jgi:hypothetical protein
LAKEEKFFAKLSDGERKVLGPSGDGTVLVVRVVMGDAVLGAEKE